MSPEETLGISYDPRLVEEAVFLAMRDHREAALFHRKRERIYKTEDPVERERAFRKLYLDWFDHLGLGGPIDEAIREQPLLLRVSRWIVAAAPPGGGQGAELFVRADAGTGTERRTVRIHLRPESFIDLPALRACLRRELWHIADMLDPSFGYEPALPETEYGPAHSRLVAERYRVLWDATIDGRMTRRGWAREPARNERLAEFRKAFPMLRAETEKAFNHFFDREPHTHAELAAFACNPRGSIAAFRGALQPGSRCPLCGFLTHAFEPEPELLPADVVAEITRHFRFWNPSRGLCTQCADLYRTRGLSLLAAMQLPGSTTIDPPSPQSSPSARGRGGEKSVP